MAKLGDLETLVEAGMALVEQIEKCNYTDGIHDLRMNKAYQEFNHLVALHKAVQEHDPVAMSLVGINQKLEANAVYGQGVWNAQERILEPVKGKVVISHVEYERRLKKDAEDNKYKTPTDLLFEPNEVIMPTYMTEKAVGADCFASEDVTIFPGEVKAVPIGIKAKFDGDIEGLFAFIRSSIPGKMGLLLANGVGVIEEDYYGNPKNDGELGFLFYNFGKKPVHIDRFDRIGQLVLTPISRFSNAGQAGMERGASGSTNK